MLELRDDKPIFLQIADGIEDGILSGAFSEETQIPSITEFSVNYKINPATALKGITMLVDNGILYKKRGVGMFVKNGAVSQLLQKRKEEFFKQYIETMATEAKRLQLTADEIIDMVRKAIA